MTISQSTLFISDLHLEKPEDNNSQKFLYLMKRVDHSVDAIYILGDLFEFWIGDDHGVKAHPEVISALKSVTEKGIPVYFLHGNRDFLIGKEFFHATGCQCIDDETVLNLYGHSVLIMHGDTLCTRDISYMNARAKLRNPLLQKIFLLLPVQIRKKIAEKMRLKSMQHTSAQPIEIMDVTQEEVAKVMQKHEVASLVHGHTHRPATHEVMLDNQRAERIVLGAWHEKGSVLVWYEDGRKGLIEL